MDDSKIPDYLRAAIRREIEYVTAEEMEKAKERIDKRKAEIVAGVVLWVEKQMKIETLQNELLIHVRLEETKL